MRAYPFLPKSPEPLKGISGPNCQLGYETPVVHLKSTHNGMGYVQSPEFVGLLRALLSLLVAECRGDLAGIDADPCYLLLRVRQ